MSDEKHCNDRGPGGVKCTRLDGHEGKHTTYPDVDGQLTCVEWFACNPIGEPIEEAEA